MNAGKACSSKYLGEWKYVLVEIEDSIAWVTLRGRAQGLKQFLDKKSFKPGLGAGALVRAGV